MAVTEWIGITTGGLTILGTIVGITRYITQLQFKVSQERLEADNTLVQKRYSDLEARYKELLDEVATSRRVGTAVLTKKLEIDESLQATMRDMRAGAGSIYIPLLDRTSSEPRGLVFLSIQPFGGEAAALKRKVIPLKSLAGRCLTTGQPLVSPNSKIDPEHFGKADLVSGYRTEDALNFPLRHKGETIGVLQLLNKESPEHFNAGDIARVEPFADSMQARVAEFVRIPDHLEVLGVAGDREAEYATVMVCDLTHSSALFSEMNATAAIRHLNEYLERMCDIALSYGATVDKYVGDGVMLRFNVPRPIEDHSLKAVKAAFDMQAAFENLKADWLTMGELVRTVYNRIGIAHGQVHQTVIGHPQYQYLTILGQPVNVAFNLCDAAVRDRNIILIDQSAHTKLQGRVIVEQLPREKLGKATAFIESAYEVRGFAVAGRST
ncbi:MAG: GAF domain-containing protein [Deltaproteobacteria bacterium]|nr:GAF domain-containing protein [Deltaproteobacteria bacterium]